MNMNEPRFKIQVSIVTFFLLRFRLVLPLIPSRHRLVIIAHYVQETRYAQPCRIHLRRPQHAQHRLYRAFNPTPGTHFLDDVPYRGHPYHRVWPVRTRPFDHRCRRPVASAPAPPDAEMHGPVRRAYHNGLEQPSKGQSQGERQRARENKGADCRVIRSAQPRHTSGRPAVERGLAVGKRASRSGYVLMLCGHGPGHEFVAGLFVRVRLPARRETDRAEPGARHLPRRACGVACPHARCAGQCRGRHHRLSRLRAADERSGEAVQAEDVARDRRQGVSGQFGLSGRFGRCRATTGPGGTTMVGIWSDQDAWPGTWRESESRGQGEGHAADGKVFREQEDPESLGRE